MKPHLAWTKEKGWYVNPEYIEKEHGFWERAKEMSEDFSIKLRAKHPWDGIISELREYLRHVESSLRVIEQKLKDEGQL